MRCQNPFAFRPGPVTFWTTAVYLALAISLIYVHETVPPAPAKTAHGLNLTEAYWDLQSITATYHPYNSHANDKVRDFYIARSKEILDRNDAAYTTDMTGGIPWHKIQKSSYKAGESIDSAANVVLFDDQISNATWTVGGAARYFEGNNFYIYIRGSEDPPGEWWRDSTKKPSGKGGVLVNCHLDSVSTGYGATDDGVACVSMLQLLNYFTVEDRQPKNGIVLLFNNAEEDGLLGAYAFGYSAILPFIHTFVNLEGAGAGGRAILFRATDLQAAKAYSGSPHPFGSVVAGDAFATGIIKSRTDYEVWEGAYGQRGLDIAFYQPRSRYHTSEDDTRHTSVRSIWHMLSAALASTQDFSKSTGTTFDGPRSNQKDYYVDNGKQTHGVWFDMFGDAWVVFALRGLFAWSLTLLVAAPVVLILVTYILVRNDKYYFFAGKIKLSQDAGDEPVAIGGWKGFFRFPLAFVFASALTIASVLLVAKFNPLIVYSSQYAVLSMTLSLFYFSFWLIMRGSSFVRPSALHRGFVIIWLFIIGWALQVAAAVFEDRLNYGFLYPFAFLQTAVFASLFISLLEQSSLLGKHDFASQLHDAHSVPSQPSRGARPTSGSTHADNDDAASETPTERTPLRAGETGYGSGAQPSFASTYRRTIIENAPAPPGMKRYKPFDHEQTWSGRLPSWTWFLQFLLLAPVPAILWGNLSLFTMSSVQMTAADGGSLATPVVFLGVVSIIFLLPLTPFIHRVTHHIPLFLLCVVTGTLIYNLVAFPFSDNHRYKFYFQQVINLDEGANTVSVIGLEEYTRQIIKTLPAAAGQEIECTPSSTRGGLTNCQFDGSGLPPSLVEGKDFGQLVSLTPFQGDTANSVKLQIDALDTRLCYLKTNEALESFHVDGALGRDSRFGEPSSQGFKYVELWRRDRNKPWTVTLRLKRSAGGSQAQSVDAVEETETARKKLGDGELKTRSSEMAARAAPLEVEVSCAWSDINTKGTIPALDEIQKYMPTWSIVSKATAGLVEVRKTFKLQVNREQED